MISKRRAKRETEAFVYITLPNETLPVTAAKFVHTTNVRGDPIGRLVYGRNYLARNDAVPFDPNELPLSNRTYETARFGGFFGAIRDSMPDHWGSLVIDRALGAPQRPIEYLLNGPDDRIGALSFGHNATPPPPAKPFNKTLDLTRLKDLADQIIADEDPKGGDSAAQVERLLLLGTSMGGARPKASVEDRYGQWLAKFNKEGRDRWNFARVECAMLALARECGIRTPDSKVVKLGNRDVLMVRRFDRIKATGKIKGYRRGRMLSALTLLGGDEGDRDRWSYLLLADEIRRISAEPEKQLHELFRRMVFNALISNTDDHPRNHAVLAMGSKWELSPAYDLTPTPSFSHERDLAMQVGLYGRSATSSNLVSASERFMISKEDASKIIEAMADQIRATWEQAAKRKRVSAPDRNRISNAFVHESFTANFELLRN